MNITTDSRFVTLLGTPLAQSFAARMQNAGFAAKGLDIYYFYNETGGEHLGAIIDGVRYMPAFLGAAITKPNKVAVMSCLDEVSPLCEKIGACNTIVKQGEKLIGHNTDAVGFTKAMEAEKFEAGGKSFFCIGAGGVGRPICVALAETGAKKIFVADLYEETARKLVEDLNSVCAPIAEFAEFGDFSHVGTCDCIINATGVGMGASVGKTPLPAELMSPDQFFFDACYNPEKTQFLLDAEARGARILNGLEMSLYQGAAQHELWTGSDAPIEVMRAELTAILAERRQEERHESH